MNIDSYYEQQGSGPPIVFIHGSYATTSTWKKIIEQLAVNHQCITLKLPGHCGMPDASDFAEPRIETELEILAQVVNKLTSEPVHLVGHSYGGVIALAQALKGNLNLSQVSLFEPVAVWVLDVVSDEKMQSLVSDFLLNYRRDVDHNTPNVVGQVIDFWAGEGAFDSLPDFIQAGMQPLVANNIRHWNICTGIQNNLSDLLRCTVPMRLICGNMSNPVAHSICDHLNQILPNSQMYVINGASHFLVTSHARKCVDVLTDQSILRQ